MRTTRHRLSASRKIKGLSLIELMISMAIGLFILGGMVSIFASSSGSHQELEKASRQIENGRYVTQVLREDIELAGFYGDYQPTATTVWTTPDPCTNVLNDMQFAGLSVPTGLFGYENGTGIAATACSAVLVSRKANTDVLVIRRVSTEQAVIDANEDNVVDNASLITEGRHYLQVSNCADSPVESAYVLGKTSGSFILHKVKPAGTPATCKNGGFSPLRAYVVRIYYVSTCNDCANNDGIPTLKVAELIPGNAGCAADPAAACGGFSVVPVAEGIEDLQLEYGIDSSGDGIADTYQTATGAVWADVVAAKAFVLARNTEATPGYLNAKVYTVGNITHTPNDAYKRNVFTITARANNISGRRQQ
jgi:type IV pilus assembly protein PilW